MRVKEIAATDVETLDKNILGKDKDVARQIKSATLAAQWPMKTQGGDSIETFFQGFQWIVPDQNTVLIQLLKLIKTLF